MRTQARNSALAVAQVALAVATGLLITRGLGFREAVISTAVLAVGIALVLLRPAERALAVLTTLLFLGLFVPSLLGRGSTPIRAEDLVLVSVAGLLLIRRVPIRFGELETGLAVLAGVAALSMLASSLQSDLPSSWSDLLFFVRLLKYALVAVVVRQLVPHLGKRRSSVLPAAMVLIALFALVGVAQYFGSATATKLFPVTASRADLLLQGESWRRAVGPIGNSNYFGFVCAVGCAVAAAHAIYQRSSLRGQVSAGVAISASFAGIVTSGSRTALLALAVMLCILVLPALRHARAWRNLAGVVVAIAAGAAFFGRLLESQPVIGRFRLFWSSPSSGSLESWRGRKGVWAEAISDVHGHALFGLGPGKGVLTQWVDNDFIRIFRDFGAVGVGAYIAVLVWWALQWWSRPGNDAPVPGAYALASSLLLGTMVMGSASDVFYQPQVMGIVVTLLAFLTARLEQGRTP